MITTALGPEAHTLMLDHQPIKRRTNVDGVELRCWERDGVYVTHARYPDGTELYTGVEPVDVGGQPGRIHTMVCERPGHHVVVQRDKFVNGRFTAVA